MSVELPTLPADLPRALAVVRRARDTHDTFTLYANQTPERPFAPGQFNMLYVPGHGDVPISISGDPEKPQQLVHTIRAVGSVTRALSRIGVGDPLFVRGPFGVGWPEPEPERAVVVIAGGIGLAPLRPLIYRSLRRSGPTYVLYGARSADELLFRDELASWAGHPQARVVVSVDRADATWRGETGVITKHIARLGLDPERVTASICGPEVMMRFAARELLSLGVGPERIFVSLERNMKCAIGHCGHCQLGTHLLCRMGPVLDYDCASKLLQIAEL